MYWLKRPHQCDAGAGERRRGAMPSRVERRPHALGGADDEDEAFGPGPRAAAEEPRDSELSELSDTDPI